MMPKKRRAGEHRVRDDVGWLALAIGISRIGKARVLRKAQVSPA
jgi:hypothetical protein